MRPPRGRRLIFLRVHDALGEGWQAGVFCDPLVVIGDSSIDARFKLRGAFLPPADNPIEEHSTIHFTQQRASRVSLPGGEK